MLIFALHEMFAVHFGINPFSSDNFDGLPRTVAEALNYGWKLDSTGGCKSVTTNFTPLSAGQVM